MAEKLCMTFRNVQLSSKYFPVSKQRGDATVKSTGIVRRVDELGRIVLPIEMRRTLNIGEKDSLEIYVDGDSIILRKYQAACVFCESTKKIFNFRGKNICPDCIAKLKEL